MDTPDTTGAPAPLPGPDDLITIVEAARLSGLSAETLRVKVRQGLLKSQLVTPRLRMTTRRWLHEMLSARGTRYQGRGPAPKPLPPDYQAPGPGRPRAPRVRPSAPLDQQTGQHDKEEE
jgi:hypothetical protein